jgi:hypothetical protein
VVVAVAVALAAVAAIVVQQIVEFCNSVSLNFSRKDDA